MPSFTFLHPDPLSDGEIDLKLAETGPGDPAKGWVPWYRFHIIEARTASVAGHLSLRIGDTEHIWRYAGHIGYAVHPDFRGRGYARRACRLIAGFARAHGYDTLWITCSPDNIPSLRTIERLGAEFVDIVEVPENEDMYRRGERRKCRFHWSLPQD